MTDFILMRHGEPDYSEIDKRKYKGFGNDLAPLTDNGIEEIMQISKDEKLKDIDIILSSPYTRTLQTASIISKELNIKIKVELDLMEWIPDKTYTYDNYASVVKWREKYDLNNGKHISSTDNWEEKEEIIQRVINVLKKYTNYSKVLIVTHGMVMNALTKIEKPNYGQLIDYYLK